MTIRIFSMSVLALVFSLLAVSARADTVGIADPYAVLGGSSQNPGITNAAGSATAITGNIGVTSSSTCTGFSTPPGFCSAGAGTVSGSIDLNTNGDGVQAAFTAAQIALGNTASIPGEASQDLSGHVLGSVGYTSLVPGVYTFTSTAQLTGTLTLVASTPGAIWIFDIGTSLTTAPNNTDVIVNGAYASSAGIYWVTGTTATLGDNATFQGNILAGKNIAFDPGAQDTCGRAFSDTLVAFDGISAAPQENVVSDTCAASTSGYSGGTIITGPGGTPIVVPTPTPEPGTFALYLSGLLGMAFLTFRKSRVSSLSC